MTAGEAGKLMIESQRSVIHDSFLPKLCLAGIKVNRQRSENGVTLITEKLSYVCNASSRAKTLSVKLIIHIYFIPPLNYNNINLSLKKKGFIAFSRIKVAPSILAPFPSFTFIL